MPTYILTAEFEDYGFAEHYHHIDTLVSTKLHEKGAVSCVPLGRSRFKSLAKDYSFEVPEQISLDDLRTTKLGYGISTTNYRRNDGNASVYLKTPHTEDQCHSK